MFSKFSRRYSQRIHFHKHLNLIIELIFRFSHTLHQSKTYISISLSISSQPYSTIAVPIQFLMNDISILEYLTNKERIVASDGKLFQRLLLNVGHIEILFSQSSNILNLFKRLFI